MRAVVCAAALALAACGQGVEQGAPDPAFAEAPAPNPLDNRDVTVREWQSGTDEQRWRAAVRNAYLPNARPDQRERMADFALRCLDRRVLSASPDAKVLDPIEGLFFECLDLYAPRAPVRAR